MKKIRRLLQVLLFINLMVGLHNEMRVENLAAVIGNGLLVIIMAALEIKEKS